jgi:hypothetical protein
MECGDCGSKHIIEVEDLGSMKSILRRIRKLEEQFAEEDRRAALWYKRLLDNVLLLIKQGYVATRSALVRLFRLVKKPQPPQPGLGILTTP